MLRFRASAIRFRHISESMCFSVGPDTVGRAGLEPATRSYRITALYPLSYRPVKILAGVDTSGYRPSRHSVYPLTSRFALRSVDCILGSLPIRTPVPLGLLLPDFVKTYPAACVFVGFALAEDKPLTAGSCL